MPLATTGDNFWSSRTCVALPPTGKVKHRKPDALPHAYRENARIAPHAGTIRQNSRANPANRSGVRKIADSRFATSGSSLGSACIPGRIELACGEGRVDAGKNGSVMRVEDEVWARLARCDFPHSSRSSSQSLDRFQPYDILLREFPSENVECRDGAAHVCTEPCAKTAPGALAQLALTTLHVITSPTDV
jgi:hypothetical protein